MMETFLGKLVDGMPLLVEFNKDCNRMLWVHDGRNWEKDGFTIKEIFWDNKWQLYKGEKKC